MFMVNCLKYIKRKKIYGVEVRGRDKPVLRVRACSKGPHALGLSKRKWQLKAENYFLYILNAEWAEKEKEGNTI